MAASFYSKPGLAQNCSVVAPDKVVKFGTKTKPNYFKYYPMSRELANLFKFRHLAGLYYLLVWPSYIFRANYQINQSFPALP